MTLRETIQRWTQNVDCPHRDPTAGEWVRFKDHARVVERLEKALADCYRATGADPDGNEDWRLAEHALAEVKRLREELDAEQVALDSRVPPSTRTALREALAAERARSTGAAERED